MAGKRYVVFDVEDREFEAFNTLTEVEKYIVRIYKESMTGAEEDLYIYDTELEKNIDFSLEATVMVSFDVPKEEPLSASKPTDSSVPVENPWSGIGRLD